MDERIKTATGPTILLHSGHYFDLLDPAGSRFQLSDIAFGLGNTWACLSGIEVPDVAFSTWSPGEASRQWLKRAEILLGRFPAHDLERLL